MVVAQTAPGAGCVQRGVPSASKARSDHVGAEDEALAVRGDRQAARDVHTAPAPAARRRASGGTWFSQLATLRVACSGGRVCPSAGGSRVSASRARSKRAGAFPP